MTNRAHLVKQLLVASALIVSFHGRLVLAEEAPSLGAIDLSLIQKAIYSDKGKSEIILGGDQARSIELMTRSLEPILASVTVLERLGDSNCARIQIDLSQDKVPTTEGGAISFSMPPVRLNICADGSSPT